MSDSRAIQAILEHVQLLHADVRDLRTEMIVRDERILAIVRNNSEKIDRNSEKIDRNSEKIDRNHRTFLAGAKERHERIERLEGVVFA